MYFNDIDNESNPNQLHEIYIFIGYPNVFNVEHFMIVKNNNNKYGAFMLIINEASMISCFKPIAELNLINQKQFR